MARRGFVKYEGLGNDFVVFDAADEREVGQEASARICDRHFGVGADGVILSLPPRDPAHAGRMRVVNADGSVPEMCGNGLRCLALHLAIGRELPERELVVETDAGPRACRVLHRGEDEATVRVDMGRVRFTAERALADLGVTVALADAGNPHAVLFGDYARADVLRLGPAIATHPAFPAGINVELARVRPEGIDLVVWERGVGLTLACGTGACATVAVARARGLVPDGAVRVRLPGGALEVEQEGDRTFMTGPARRVFTGELAPGVGG